MLAANTRAGRGEAHAGNIMGSTGEVTISKRLWQEMKHQEGRIRRKGKTSDVKDVRRKIILIKPDREHVLVLGLSRRLVRQPMILGMQLKGGVLACLAHMIPRFKFQYNPQTEKDP